MGGSATRWVVGVCLLVFTVVLAGCPDSDPGAEECDAPGAACSPVVNEDTESSYARACILVDAGERLECRNVCEAPDPGYPDGAQQEGELCEHDPDCVAGTHCDNDVTGGAASCRCLTTEPECETDLVVGQLWDFQGRSCAPENFWPALFDVQMTCQTDTFRCEERTRAFGFAQDQADPSITCFGLAQCDELPDGCTNYVGRLCGSELVWQEAPDLIIGSFEQGVIRFINEEQLELTMTSHPSPGEPETMTCTGEGRLRGTGDLDEPPDCDHYFPFGVFECEPGAMAPGEPRPGEGEPGTVMCAYEARQCPDGCACEGEEETMRPCTGDDCSFRAPCQIVSADCVPAFDVSGLWEEYYTCVDPASVSCEEATLRFRLSQQDNQVRIQEVDGEWVAYGYLCDDVLHWFARTEHYFEYGFWEFDDAEFFHKTSSYSSYDGPGGGDCIGIGWRDGADPLEIEQPADCL